MVITIWIPNAFSSDFEWHLNPKPFIIGTVSNHLNTVYVRFLYPLVIFYEQFFKFFLHFQASRLPERLAASDDFEQAAREAALSAAQAVAASTAAVRSVTGTANQTWNPGKIKSFGN